MHPDFPKAQDLSHQLIGAAIEVHRHKGPGLLESIYEKCLMRELVVPIEYKGFTFEEPLRLDVYAEGCVIVENKVVETIQPVHRAQLLSYMRLLNAPIGLIFNFNTPLLKDGGIDRLILPGADRA